jgi:predicted RNase H-like HicB family nuclease
MRTFTAYIEYDEETKLFVGMVPSLTGAHTIGKTLEELRDNLKEVIELCLESNQFDINELHNRFVGIQQIEVSV